jgi:hypothetical protein
LALVINPAATGAEWQGVKTFFESPLDFLDWEYYDKILAGLTRIRVW